MIPEHLKEAIVKAIQYKGELLGQKDLSVEAIKKSIQDVEYLENCQLFKVFCEGEPDAFVFGIIMPYHLCLSLSHATILVSWFTEENRGIKSIKLVEKFVKWAEENKADGIELDDCLCNPEVGRIYEKWGFKRVETHYYKVGDK